MRKIILSILMVLLISSCNKQPECSGSDVKNTLFSIVKEEIVKEYENGYFNKKWDYSSVKDYAKDNNFNVNNFIEEKKIELKKEAKLFAEQKIKETTIELDAVRFLSKEEDLKKCSCTADLIIDRERETKIEYTAQYTEEGKVYVELSY